MTRLQLVLDLLRKAGPRRGVTTGEFLQAGAGNRFGGRICELRKLGHVIETTRVRAGAFRYQLTRDAERDGVERSIDIPDPRTPPRRDQVGMAAAPLVDAPPDAVAHAASLGAEQPAEHDSAPPPSCSQTPSASPPPTLFDANEHHHPSYQDIDEEAA